MHINRHFFEALERENNYKEEYNKLETMISIEGYRPQYHYGIITINDWIEENFREWKKRKNYTTFREIRKQIGFDVTKDDDDRLVFWATNIGLNEYLLFCETIFNVVMGLLERKVIMPPQLEKQLKFIFETMTATMEKAGFEIRHIDDQFIAVEKSAPAVAVAELAPELANVIIEYNHYLLRGDITRKKEILRHIADAMEPKRKELDAIVKQETDDFFWMINKMNIRHNNIDPTDRHNYFEAFALLPDNEKEQWYDRIYEQSLALFVRLDQQERSRIIHEFKKSNIQ